LASAAIRLFHHLGAAFDCLGAALDLDRVLAYCRILIVAEIVGLLFLVAGTHGLIVPLARPTSTDFVSFYAAGALANAGTPELVYDQSAHNAAEERATAIGVEYRFFYYPPVFLLVCAAFARLPYLAAFLAFEGVTLALFLIVMRQILDQRGWPALIPVLAFPALYWTLGLGQNSFLTAALFAAGTLWIDRRPILAGICFGALCYKPHFGLLVPVALLAGRHWRAFVAALLAAAALCALSLALFGLETWAGFLRAAFGAHTTYESGRIIFGGFVSPFGAVLLVGGAAGAAYAAQAAATLAAAIFVAVVWRHSCVLPIRAAALTAATLVAIPVVLIYDLMLAAVAAAWLSNDYEAPPPWEKVALAVLLVLCVDPRGLAELSRIPIAPLVAIGMVTIIAARTFRAAAPRTTVA
jgi:glycosyl transferase family 87